jgi:hypothetical protein
MKLGSLAGARPMYYDRNPVVINGNFFGLSIAPHATTTRWTITNPSTKKAYIDAGSIAIMRMTAATTASMGFAAIEQPSGNPVLLCVYSTSTVNSVTNMSLSGTIYVGPGDSVLGITYDGSIGGTIFYTNYAHGVQFDA